MALLFGVMIACLSLSVFAGEAPHLVSKDIVYGDRTQPDKEFQSLDIYWKDAAKQRPVIIYIHDGGWAFGDKSDVHLKPQFFALHDISFISMNYRLRWEYDLYDQLEDVASVIAWVKKNHKNYGLNPDRIVLMGHGAGAHLAALVAADASILKTRNLKLTDIKAVVTVDTLSFDIPMLMQEGNGSFMEQRRHRLVFGDDDNVWKAASPITHVRKESGVPPFAILYVADSESTAMQARSFAKLLRDVGSNVVMIPGNQKTTRTIDEELGTSGDAPTLALIAFLRAVI